MDAQMSVHVTAGAPQFGVWCPHCANSAAATVAIYAIADLDQPTIATLGTVTRCTDCDLAVPADEEDDQHVQ